MSNQNKISIKGARVNNLKNIDLEIPRNKLVVITGLSGSGKSSLAFDTIYAEGQRRYVESLSSYARQFLEVKEKPDVDFIGGLSPAIAIDQKVSSKNPRSTVGTVTEIYDLFRLLYSRIGHLHCPECGVEVKKQSLEEILEKIWQINNKINITVLAPVVRGQKGNQKKVLAALKKANYYQVRVNGSIYEITEAEDLSLDINKNHNIEVVIDRILLDGKKDTKEQLTEAVKIAADLGDGLIIIYRPDEQKDVLFSQYYNCPKCNVNLPEIELRSFSFNSPFGACPECLGLGQKNEFNPVLVVANPRLTIEQGAIRPFTKFFSLNTKAWQILTLAAKKHKISLATSVEKLSKKALEKLLFGTGKEFYEIGNQKVVFPGIIHYLKEKYNDSDSEYIHKELEKYMRVHTCTTCNGRRLKPSSLAVTVGGQSIDFWVTLAIEKLSAAVSELVKSLKFSNEKKLPKEFIFVKEALNTTENKIAGQIIKEIKRRVVFLENVGLGYLTLSRSVTTLSGGENQRIRLATQLGSALSEVIYVLDEPSIGLHPKDNEKLINTLKKLRDKNNSVIVVEHDSEMMQAADYLIDIGPGAGVYGGKVISEGTFESIKKDSKSLTGQYLAGKKKIEVLKKEKRGNGKNITIKGATAFNLKNINVKIPLGKFVCVTGVSGSGKSTLISEILSKSLTRKFHHSKALPAEHKEITGLENLDKVITIDQSPIGRTPRSNPATYTGVFTYIRDLFTQVPEAKIKGFEAGKFSFNVKGGRCEECSGDGLVKIEMQFLPDVYVECKECKGRRYKKEVLEVHYRGRNIADVLEMTVSEAKTFFHDTFIIKDKLSVLEQVGLGYLKLGQSATTLSGGEAQRIKLATELSRYATGKTLYILDEPTTGLHFDDINKLLLILNKLVDKGNSVLIIEHNLDVIKNADYIIDLGPGGGEQGGELVAEGSPAQVAEVKDSITGQYLSKIL